MDLRSRILTGAKAAAGRVAGALGAFASAAPVVPGVGRNRSGVTLTRDEKAQRIVESRDALYGRVSTALGPIGANISTHPLAGLTPQRVTSILNQVYVAGWMVDWACLVEDVYRYDTEVRTLQESGSEAVTGAPFTIEPADHTDEGRAVADYQQAVVNGIDTWPSAMEGLLLGNSAGYQLAESAFEDRVVRFPYKDSFAEVEAPTPVGFDPIHSKHTRFDLSLGERLELDTGSGFIVPPEWKFVRYEASGPYAVRNRGWMSAAVWLAMIKSGAWARWGVVLDLWGVPTPLGFADKDLWQNEARRAEMLQALIDFGQGKPALFTDDFKIESSTAPSSPLDARGMHAAIISAIDMELSKLILGSVLTTEISGTGSYNMSSTHADTKETRVRKWEMNLSACVRRWMRAVLKLAIYEVRPDGSYGEVSRRGLCAALGIPPERVLALCGRPSWRIQREATPEARMGLYKDAKNELGLEIDRDSAFREFGLARARNKSNSIPGKPVVLAGDAAATSTTDANRGVSNPKEDEAPAEAA